MNKTLRSTLAIAFGAALGATMLPAHATDDHDKGGNGSNALQNRPLQVIGLTDDHRLVSFSHMQPDNAKEIGAVSGLMSGDMLIGIDFRVQDGKLYGVSKSGGIYMLDQGNASATKVSQLTVALEGSSFGVDFNPAADRLRVVSDTGQNLRHNINPQGTTLVDDPLDYPPATPLNAIGPNAIGITGSAYTNNDLDASTGTTLYAFDATLDQLALQSPPNDGTLAAAGKLGANAGMQTGFDIYSAISDGATVDVIGLASVHVENGTSGLYSVSLPTGKLKALGNFAGNNKVIGIAIPLDQFKK